MLNFSRTEVTVQSPQHALGLDRPLLRGSQGRSGPAPASPLGCAGTERAGPCAGGGGSIPAPGAAVDRGPAPRPARHTPWAAGAPSAGQASAEHLGAPRSHALFWPTRHPRFRSTCPLPPPCSHRVDRPLLLGRALARSWPVSPHRAFEQGRRRGRRPQGASHHREASRLPLDGEQRLLCLVPVCPRGPRLGPAPPCALLRTCVRVQGASLDHVVGAPEPLARARSARG